MKILYSILLMGISLSVVAQNSQKTSKVSTPNKAQIEAIKNLIIPVRQQVQLALQNLDAKMYEAYKKDLELMDATYDVQQQKKMATDFKTKYYAFFKQGYTLAKIDESGFKSKMLSILELSPSQVQFSEFMNVTSVRAAAAPPLSPPANSNCVEVKCPLLAQNSTMPNGGGLSNCGCNALSLGADGDRLTAIGAHFDLDDYRQIYITAMCDYRLSVFTSGNAFGFFSATVGVEVKTPTGFWRIERDAAWAIAVAGFPVDNQQIGNSILLQEGFRTTSGNDDYTVQVYTSASNYLIGKSRAEASIDKVHYLKVCQEKY